MRHRVRDISERTRSDWTFEIIAGDVIHIIDLNLGQMSVTNDAEQVVAELHKAIGLTNRRVQYVDSEGAVDQLVHNNGVFIDFAAGPAKVKT